jgi:hypothetical protein
MTASAVLYDWPPDRPRSTDYALRVDGRDVFVHQCGAGSYAILSLGGPASVEVKPAFEFGEAKVRPLSRGVGPEIRDGAIRFGLDGPAYLSVELDGDTSRPLFVLAAPEEDTPSPQDVPGVRCFAPGRVHEAGRIALHDGEEVYIEGGAVVHGAIEAENASGVTVRGRGILDGRIGAEQDRHRRSIRFVGCRDVTVEGITVDTSPSWTLVPMYCDGVAVRHFKAITWRVGGDGVDLVACRNATVEDCFLRTADDCVAVKAFSRDPGRVVPNVEHVTVSGCVLWNARPGNALEIGYETRCDSISDVVFRDIDVIRCEHEGHQSGGVLTIHNADRAVVSNVRYEDIRVEDAQEKLIDLKVLLARYSRDTERGQIRHVCFKDVRVVDGPFPVSIIRGYEPDHIIEDVTVENLTVYGRTIADAREAHMVVELARGVRFA